MKEFFENLVSTWWGILIICLVCIAVWILISALLYRQFFKRFYDIVLSLLALIILSPILLIVSIIVRIKLGSPVVFKQERPGRNEKVFVMYKFKTMLPPQTRDGKKLTDNERLECVANGVDILTDEERLTKTGRILRALSLDELLEFVNILKGDMSFVGPRPLSTIYLPYYNETERHRHDVRPGLTGLAQVNGRNSTSWEKRFEYDIAYVKKISLWTDLKILFQTMLVVFKRSGIAQGNECPESFNIVRKRELEEAQITEEEITSDECNVPGELQEVDFQEDNGEN